MPSTAGSTIPKPRFATSAAAGRADVLDTADLDRIAALKRRDGIDDLRVEAEESTGDRPPKRAPHAW